MRKLIKICAAASLLHLAAGCASPPPPTPDDEGPGEAFITFVDSLDITSYDFLFMQIHADLLEEIERREELGQYGAGLIEVRAVLSAAERIYLEGNYAVAIELLAEADELLRNIP
jgi:hypothetical protein